MPIHAAWQRHGPEDVLTPLAQWVAPRLLTARLGVPLRRAPVRNRFLADQHQGQIERCGRLYHEREAAEARVFDIDDYGARLRLGRASAVRRRYHTDMRCMTPAEWLVDREGRPYFLWDVNMTLDEFRSRLASGADRDYWLAVLLRQAKPDDVYQFVGLEEIREAWPRIDRGLGKQRAFWQWRLARWERDGK